MIQAVIFDVDGTLVDSTDFHVAAWREAFMCYGKELTHNEVHSQIGKGADQLMPVFLSLEELDLFGDELEKLRVDLFTQRYLPRVKPFPKVRELFVRIKADGMRIALASSAKQEELDGHKSRLQIEDLVDAATSADDVHRSKPCPDVFQAALERLHQVAPQDAIVVGDTPYDAMAAAYAGMQAIGVLSGGFSEKSLRAHGAIAVYRDVADLYERYDESPLSREHTQHRGVA
ncbi:MAG: HAD family hydrolase [Burkholderiales bacterium]